MKDTALKGDNFDFCLDKSGFYYLYIREGEEFNLEDYNRIFSHINTTFNHKKAPFLVELGYGCSFGEGVLEVLTKSTRRNSTADALVTNTYAHQLTVKFYMRHYDPAIPTEMFDNKEEAAKWLQQYIPK